jgi:TolB-like protein/Flp pilus assembly protein TadD
MAEERVQRRLAAIMAADVVGYSRLMEADEAGTHAALKSWRKEALEPVVARHQGRIFKLTGDGVLVEFGSAVNAVQCAVELQHRMAAANAGLPPDRHILLRIGINLGEVMVEDSDLYGDGVIIATRLEGIAEPGGIIVSGTAYDHIKSKVKVGFDDIGAQTLKNITGPVRAYRVSNTPSVAPAPVTADRSSIAVLPFTNMSGDPQQEYFSDGITEDIITELSRFRSLFVIARNTSFTFKGPSVDVRKVGRELGVRYVAEGSVRRAGNRVRITAQLIDAQAGHHIWADRYDRDLEDVFAVQDEVTRQIVNSIAPRLQSEDLQLAKRKMPSDLRAYDHYLRAKPLVDAPASLSDLARAREHCDAALAIDPTYARAYAYKALSYVIGASLLELGDIAGNKKLALECAERAVSLDDNDSVCHWVLGEAALLSKQRDRAKTQLKKSLILNPNDADAIAASGYVQVVIGDPDLGLQQLNMALERNPSSPAMYHWLRGISLSILGRYDESLAELATFNPPNPSIMRWRAYALMKLGRAHEASAQVQALLAARPELTISSMTELLGYLPNHQDMVESLRQAGLPE